MIMNLAAAARVVALAGLVSGASISGITIALTGCSFTASRDVLAYDTCVARHPQERGAAAGATDRRDDVHVAERCGFPDRQRRHVLFIRRRLLPAVLQRQQRVLRSGREPCVRRQACGDPFGSDIRVLAMG